MYILGRGTRNSITALLYRYTGIDLHDLICRMFGCEKGRNIQHLIAHRTGKPVPAAPSISETIEAVKVQYNL